MILLDTHVVIWLYEGVTNRIPAIVRRRLDSEQPGLSPITHLELGYAHEIGRIAAPANAIVEELRIRFDLVLADISAMALCSAALPLTWTRDPFDRLLAAHSLAHQLTLVTADEQMRRHLPLAWWAD